MRTRRHNQKGFVLVTMAICVIGLLGMVGLVFDIGRAFITKNEAQAFTDAAALAAAVQLNGNSSGLTNASNAVTTMKDYNKWHLLDKEPYSTVTVVFSTDKINWTTTPPSPPTGVKYAKVTALNNSVTMYFLTVVGTAEKINVAATSVAGGEMPTTFDQGVFPFAPLGKSTVAPDFGYSVGDELTLLWPSSVESVSKNPVHMNNLCGADKNQAALAAVLAGTTADRGYIQDTAASSLAAAIEDDHMDDPVTLGQSVTRTGGVKNHVVADSLDERVAQDSSPHEADYNRYISSHDSSPLRRLVIVPILRNATDSTVVGFAKVFLPPHQPQNPNDAKCATYIGPADGTGGNMGSGANIVRLLQ